MLCRVEELLETLVLLRAPRRRLPPLSLLPWRLTLVVLLLSLRRKLAGALPALTPGALLLLFLLRETALCRLLLMERLLELLLLLRFPCVWRLLLLLLLFRRWRFPIVFFLP